MTFGSMPGAGDGLAELIDDQQIELVERNVRQMLLSRRRAGACRPREKHRTMAARLRWRTAGDIRSRRPRRRRGSSMCAKLQLRHGAHGIPQTVAVRLVRADLLAEPDGAHLQQSGGERAGRLGVRLRSAQHDDAVRLEREPVHVRDGAVSDTPSSCVSIVARTGAPRCPRSHQAASGSPSAVVPADHHVIPGHGFVHTSSPTSPRTGCRRRRTRRPPCRARGRRANTVTTAARRAATGSTRRPRCRPRC